MFLINGQHLPPGQCQLKIDLHDRGEMYDRTVTVSVYDGQWHSVEFSAGSLLWLARDLLADPRLAELAHRQAEAEHRDRLRRRAEAGGEAPGGP